MVKIGFHVSIAGNISNSIDNILKIGCNTFQIFSRSPRKWSTKPLKEEDIENFRKKKDENKFDSDSIFVHMPYLPNLASSNERLHKRSTSVLTEEIERCELLQISYIILHLGTHGGSDGNQGIKQLVNACKFAIENYHETNLKNNNSKKIKNKTSSLKKSVGIILENNTGKKNSIGSQFDELAIILDKVKSSVDMRSTSVGICLDTCHAFVAGYDLRTQDKVYETLDILNDQVGLKNVKVLHLNDSKGNLNSNHDLHEHIGLGKIGIDGFKSILNDKRINKVPIIMETPIDRRRNHLGNLKVVKDIVGNNNNR
jgi:deoxyribonuclease IV